MANWNYDPRIKERSADPAVRELQQAFSEMSRKLRVALRELDADNIAPDFLPGITNAEKAEVQVIKGKVPNAYIGNDGQILKVLNPSGGSSMGLPHVGFIHMSNVWIDVQVYYGGGTWEQIKDCFLLAAGDVYAVGTTGGEVEHTLTVDELPAHTHPQSVVGARSGSGDTYVSWNASNLTGSTASSYNNTYSTGGGAAHNNMPPYRTIYAWVRVA